MILGMPPYEGLYVLNGGDYFFQLVHVVLVECFTPIDLGLERQGPRQPVGIELFQQYVDNA
jgi:hypothetical protein